MDRPAGVCVPAPIFNRRRPRQALFAHPNNQNETGAAIANVPAVRGQTTQSNCQGTSASAFHGNFGKATNNIQGTKTASYQPSAPSFQPGPRGYPTGGSNYQKSTQSVPTHTMIRPNVPRQTFSSSNQYQSTHGPQPMFTNNVRQPNPQNIMQSDYDAPTLKTQPAAFNNSDNNSHYNRTNMTPPTQMSKQPSSFFGSSNSCQKTQNIPYHISNSASTNCGMSDISGNIYQNNHSSYGSALQQNRPNYGTQASTSSSLDGQPKYGDCPRVRDANTGQHSQYGQQPWGTPALPDAMDTSNNWSVTPTPATQFTATQKCPKPSLHFITASLQGFKHWSQYNRKMPMFFEIFGTLNSAVSVSNDCLQFVIKDDRDNIRCSFYQIDRQLDRLVRAQWLRCVGTYSETTKTMLCVSVRKATETEVKLHRKYIATADKSLKKITNNL